MSYGHSTTVQTACCNQEVTHVDYTRDPPPIPPGSSGSYATLNAWDGGDGKWIDTCPRCDRPLPDPSTWRMRAGARPVVYPADFSCEEAFKEATRRWGTEGVWATESHASSGYAYLHAYYYDTDACLADPRREGTGRTWNEVWQDADINAATDVCLAALALRSLTPDGCLGAGAED